MANTPTAQKVTELVKSPIEGLGYILWDVRFVKEGASWYLRVFIDKDGGVDINDCVDVTHLIDPIIDDADPINVSYCLEVCSPGLDRELTEYWHFKRYIGSEVLVKLIRPREKVKEFKGTLIAFDGGVTINTDDGEIYFAKSEIVNVRLCDADFN
jgi:ribosome maturation factor RimP